MDIFVKSFPASGEDDAGQYVEENLGIVAIADGLSGHRGAFASNFAVSSMLHNLRLRKERITDKHEESAKKQEESAKIMNELFKDSLQATNEKLQKADAGTTIDILVTKGALGHMAHIGDGRIYVARKTRVDCVTQDEGGAGDEFSSDRTAPSNFLGKEEVVRLNQSGSFLLDGVLGAFLTTDGLFTRILEKELCDALQQYVHPALALKHIEELIRNPQRKLDLLMGKRPEFAAEIRTIVENGNWQGQDIVEARKRANEGMRIIEPARAYMMANPDFDMAVRKALIPLMDKDDITFMYVDFSNATPRLIDSETEAWDIADKKGNALERVYFDITKTELADEVDAAAAAQNIIDAAKQRVSGIEQSAANNLQNITAAHKLELDAEKAAHTATSGRETAAVGALAEVYEVVIGTPPGVKSPSDVARETSAGYASFKAKKEGEVEAAEALATALGRKLRRVYDALTETALSIIGRKPTEKEMEQGADGIISQLTTAYTKKIKDVKDSLEAKIAEVREDLQTAYDIVENLSGKAAKAREERDSAQGALHSIAEEVTRQYNSLFVQNIPVETVQNNPSSYFNNIVLKFGQLLVEQQEGVIIKMYEALGIKEYVEITRENIPDHLECVKKVVRSICNNNSELAAKVKTLTQELDDKQGEVNRLKLLYNTFFWGIRKIATRVNIGTGMTDERFAEDVAIIAERIVEDYEKREKEYTKVKEELDRLKNTDAYKALKRTRWGLAATAAGLVTMAMLYLPGKLPVPPPVPPCIGNNCMVQEDEKIRKEIGELCERAGGGVGKYIAKEECAGKSSKEALEAIRKKEEYARVDATLAQLMKEHLGIKEKPGYCVNGQQESRATILFNNPAENPKTIEYTCDAFGKAYSWLKRQISNEQIFKPAAIRHIGTDFAMEITEEGQKMPLEDIFGFPCLKIGEGEGQQWAILTYNQEKPAQLKYYLIKEGKRTRQIFDLRDITKIVGEGLSEQCKEKLPLSENEQKTSELTPPAVEAPNLPKPPTEKAWFIDKTVWEAHFGGTNLCYVTSEGQLVFRDKDKRWGAHDEGYVLVHEIKKPENVSKILCGIFLDNLVEGTYETVSGGVKITAIPKEYKEGKRGPWQGFKENTSYETRKVGERTFVTYTEIIHPKPKPRPYVPPLTPSPAAASLPAAPAPSPPRPVDMSTSPRAETPLAPLPAEGTDQNTNIQYKLVEAHEGVCKEFKVGGNDTVVTLFISSTDRSYHRISNNIIEEGTVNSTDYIAVEYPPDSPHRGTVPCGSLQRKVTP